MIFSYLIFLSYLNIIVNTNWLQFKNCDWYKIKTNKIFKVNKLYVCRQVYVVYHVTVPISIYMYIVCI
jgi:hypothetical protein